jgi:hypothetical protein
VADAVIEAGSTFPKRGSISGNRSYGTASDFSSTNTLISLVFIIMTHRRSTLMQLFGHPTSQQIAFQITNTSDLVNQYTIDGQTLFLPPQATHTHQPCRPAEVTIHWLGT